MSVNRNVVKAMFVGGVFAGLAGVFEVLGVFHYQTIAAGSSGYGFDGVAVALLGGNHPLGVVLAATLFGSLTYGSAGMSFGATCPRKLSGLLSVSSFSSSLRTVSFASCCVRLQLGVKPAGR